MTDSRPAGYVLAACVHKTNLAGLVGVIALGLIVRAAVRPADCPRSVNCTTRWRAHRIGSAVR